MPRDAVSRTANVGTVGKNGLIEGLRVYRSNVCCNKFILLCNGLIKVYKMMENITQTIQLIVISLFLVHDNGHS